MSGVASVTYMENAYVKRTRALAYAKDFAIGFLIGLIVYLGLYLWYLGIMEVLKRLS